MEEPWRAEAIQNNSKTQIPFHVKLKRQLFKAFKFWKEIEFPMKQ